MIPQYKLAEPEIPKISPEKFMALTPEQQDRYLYLYRTQVVPKMNVFREHHSYKVAYGGRGSGKSVGVASLLMQELTKEPHRLMCCREIQNSITDSSYRLLIDTIDRLQLKGWQVFKDRLEHENGSRVIFRGLKDMRAARSIKSIEGVDRVWIEEAQSVSRESLQLLLPSIRVTGSEIYATYNPETEEDPIEMLKTREDVISIKLNFPDNPWFNDRLKEEMEADFRMNEDEACHIWLGEYRKQADNAVMSRTVVREAMDRDIDGEGDYELACDVARYGDDSTVIVMRKGLRMTELKELKQKSLLETADAIETMCGRRHNLKMKIDETGVGGGLVDILRGRGYTEVIGINFGSKAQDSDKYSDLPSEMWCTFPIAEVKLLDNDRLFHELTNRRYSYDSKARRCVESKDAYKARNSGKSPDFADAVLMLYYEPKIIRPMLY